jgi:plasmanylethanolamine desaturase
MLFLKICCLVLLADFLTGLFHFYVDKYAVMDSKYLTVSINGLLIHHDFPQKMVSQSYWELTKGVYKIGGVIFLFSLFFGLHWELLFFILVSAQANLIHKWSHLNKQETPIIVNYLQKFYIIQNKKHHLKHHNGKYDEYYCVMTNICNPLLQKIHFWESIVKTLKYFGIHPVNRTIQSN